MTGKREISGVAAETPNDKDVSSNSKSSSDTEEGGPTAATSDALCIRQSECNSPSSNSNTSAVLISETASQNWSLVPVHITTDNTLSKHQYDGCSNFNGNGSSINGGGNFVNYNSSSSSSIDSLYRYQDAPRSVPHRQYSKVANFPSLPAEQMTLNIQRNLEHCAQQQRQQMENIIREYSQVARILLALKIY